MRTRLHRTLLLLATAAMLGAGCTFNAVEPPVYTCNAVHPQCPAGLSCLGGHCVAGGSDAAGGETGKRDRVVTDSRSPDAPTTCGNGKVDPGEQCDGTNLDSQTCESQLQGNGKLACFKCRFDVTACCTAPKPPSDILAVRIVSASTGSDLAAGLLEKAGKTNCVAYKTIGGALAGPPLKAASIIWVAPGKYTQETFPIVLSDVQIRGDIASKGADLSNPTIVAGAGLTASGERCTFVIQPGFTQLHGLTIDTATTGTQAYGVCVQESTTKIEHNTYRGENGVHVEKTGKTCPSIGASDFNTTNIGVNMECGGLPLNPGTIQDNTFKTGKMMIRVGASATVISGNTFYSASWGIFVENTGTAPNITKNNFAGVYDIGGVTFQSGPSGSVRDNLFTSSTPTTAVVISDGTPELGKPLNPGSNAFGPHFFSYTAATGTISATGNTWKTNPPCPQIKTNGGKVQYGIGPQEVCPP